MAPRTAAAPASSAGCTYSIRAQFSGASVLLTGATGYVGSLVLEALLRLTDVGRVYVLLRPKGGAAPEQRLAQLVQGSLFHKVRDQPQLTARVVAVAGDISLPGLGLSDRDRAEIQERAQIILHCAADIRLEVDIHTALKSNYLGTKAVLDLARGSAQLRALVHTSSAFVNMNQPRSSVVGERLYPLAYGRRRVAHEEVVQDLLSLPPPDADTRALALGARWGFPNNYALSKHLAEQLVGSCRSDFGVPAAIVRPSLVCAVCYEPIPGFVGNWAGPIGAASAMALGFYHSLACVSSEPLHVWDIIPGDMAAAAVIAAAAATAAGAGGGVAADAAAAFSRGVGAAGSSEAGGEAEGSGGAAPPMLIVHASSSSTWPMTLMEGWNSSLEFIAVHKPKFRLSWALPPRMTPAFRPDPRAVARARQWTGLKVAAACALLRLAGLGKPAARLRSGFGALRGYSSRNDTDLVFSSDALQLLEARLPAAERSDFRLVMRPGLPLPSNVAEGGASGSGASGGGGAAEEPLLGGGGGGDVSGGGRGVLTWRRYYHSMLAGVYTALFRSKLPRRKAGAGGPGAAPVEHDFVFVR